MATDPALASKKASEPESRDSVEPGYRPIHLPKLDIVAVDETPGGFDSGDA
jgi:hypothetical protein